MAMTFTYVFPAGASAKTGGTRNKFRHRVEVSIPGTEDYGADGVRTFTPASLGCPQAVEKCIVVGVNGVDPTPIWQIDMTTTGVLGPILRGYETAAAAEGQLAEIDSGDQPAAATITLEVEGY